MSRSTTADMIMWGCGIALDYLDIGLWHLGRALDCRTTPLASWSETAKMRVSSIRTFGPIALSTLAGGVVLKRKVPIAYNPTFPAAFSSVVFL